MSRPLGSIPMGLRSEFKAELSLDEKHTVSEAEDWYQRMYIEPEGTDSFDWRRILGVWNQFRDAR